MSLIKEEFIIYVLRDSLEWRVWAFVITFAITWMATKELKKATRLTIVIQLALFAAHTIWLYFKYYL